MQSGADVIKAIRESLKGEERLPLDIGTAGRLWDENGNLVGGWEVKRDLSAALDAVADQQWADAHEPDSPSTAPEPPHIFSDKDVKGYCDVCGMRKHHPDANHAE